MVYNLKIMDSDSDNLYIHFNELRWNQFNIIASFVSIIYWYNNNNIRE